MPSSNSSPKTSPKATPNEQTKDGDDQNGSNDGSYFPTGTVAAITRFLSFKSTPKPEFPPHSWDLAQTQNEGAGASEWKYDPELWKKDIVALKDQVREEQEKAEEEEKKRLERERKESEKQKERERQSIAQRIRALIGLMPSFNPQAAPAPPQAEGEPVAPATQPDNGADEADKARSSYLSSSFAGDSMLRGMLYSQSIMNGVASGASKGKESVWSILERMGPMKAKTPAAEQTPMDSTATSSTESESESEDRNGAEEDGIMMYAPLEPDSNSEVELADSDVLEYVGDPNTQAPSTASSITLSPDSQSKDTTGQDKGKGKSPESRPGLEKKWSSRFRKSQSKSKSQSPSAGNKEKKLHREWHPSPTQLSVHATWWGYRLYLPPPILDVLSDARITAAKRGALITAALKWLLDSIPILLVPPPLRPAVMMIKKLSPYLGYIGAFVAWSWEKIKQQDKGNGVVLTATWLLPVALIPDTWDLEAHGHPVARPPKVKKSKTKKDKEKVTIQDGEEGQSATATFVEGQTSASTTKDNGTK